MDEAKKKRQFNKNYMYLNKTMVGLAIYVIFFPFMASIIEKINPEILVCPYLKMTGNPCPLCGGTRYFRGLGKVLTDPSYLLHPFGVMAIVILQFFEIWVIAVTFSVYAVLSAGIYLLSAFLFETLPDKWVLRLILHIFITIVFLVGIILLRVYAF